MELPQSRLFEAQGRKKKTHDFLSVCNNPTVYPDPMPSTQGGYIKTHDFLQPLERVGTRACAKEEVIRGSVNTTAELKSPHAQNQHVLPGGIGTYTISHIPNYLYRNHQHQSAPKSEVSPMYTVSQASSNMRAEAATMEQWQETKQRSSFSSSSSLHVKRQRQSFMDMIKSAKGSSQEDDLDDEDEEFVTKKGNNTSTTSQCQRDDLKIKVDMKTHGNEPKPNTPRSKHSATEQRRRSKINDRFQTLRQLIPNSDQKRDKASFLQEVIEYIHFLQEKVDKHEVVPNQGKLMNWRNHQHPPEGTVSALAEAQAGDMGHKKCLNKAIEATLFPVLGQRTKSSQLCPLSSDPTAATENENLGEGKQEEELNVRKGTISISSVYSQELLKTLTETLQRSGVDLSKSSISVQIKLSKQHIQKDEVHQRIRPRSPSGDETHNGDENVNIKQIRKPKKFKKTTYNGETE